MNKIGVISIEGDVHVQALRHLSKNKGGSVLSFQPYHPRSAELSSIFNIGDDGFAEMVDVDGRRHNLADIACLWWRRPFGTNQLPESEVERLILSSMKHQILGAFEIGFKGKILNRPVHAERAELKHIQIQEAKRAGLNVPRTLISNDGGAIRRFAEEQDGNVVMKSLFNTEKLQIKTTLLSPELLTDENSLSVCPTIYQSMVDGYQHVRAFVISNQYRAIVTENPAIDSRIDLSVPSRPYFFDPDTEAGIYRFMRQMRLDMGVFDFKIDQLGKIWFFEVNQQGQFAYLDISAEVGAMELLANTMLAYQ